MQRDYLEFRVLADGKAQKSDIERSGLQHLDLIYCENIAKGEFYFCIPLSKLTNDCGHNLIASSRYESDPQIPSFPLAASLAL
jgi:hypothetical protein